jgi:hypothetical protein
MIVRSSHRDVPETDLSFLERLGHVYRGVTEDEWVFIGRTGMILSSGRYSLPGEGTSFGSIATAESYVNFGRDDPRKTGRPTYIVEIPRRFTTQDRDGYWKAKDPVPKAAITRAWRMNALGGFVIMKRVPVP